jgi:S1-C subfamily serine protease
MEADRGVRTPIQSGSGFVWDDKHVMTNHHVIANFKSNIQITVLSSNGNESRKTVKAVLVGSDADRDIALLRLETSSIILPPPLEHGKSKNLRVGQSILAIGNPFGLDQTLTSGVISGLERRVATGLGQLDRNRPLTNLIQTDAAINPGNSGGPLLDSSGRLIGMNTAILSTSGAFAGIGFAIPVDTLQVVANAIIRDGNVARINLGIEYASGRIARLLGAPAGLVVLRVQRGSPAHFAGVRGAVQTGALSTLREGVPGDVLTEVNGRSVSCAEDLLSALGACVAGDVVRLKVLRVSSTDHTGAHWRDGGTRVGSLKEVTLSLRL